MFDALVVHWRGVRRDTVRAVRSHGRGSCGSVAFGNVELDGWTGKPPMTKQEARALYKSQLATGICCPVEVPTQNDKQMLCIVL